MYQVYHSSNIVGKGGTDSNHYHIADAELDQWILDARSSADTAFRKQIYKTCLDRIIDWAVEIPNYQRKDGVIFSTERIKVDTLPTDLTPFYGWMSELYKLEMQ
jgi:peptide/nickel transport system substrate-binding protein